MDREEMKKLKEELEKKVDELETYVTADVFNSASEEEKQKYIKLIAEIKMKLAILE